MVDHLGLSRILLFVGVGFFRWRVKDLGTARINRAAEYDEIKAEIAELKKENRSLKSGCSENGVFTCRDLPAIRTHKVRRNEVLANYAYDRTGNLAFATSVVDADASWRLCLDAEVFF
ncbi:MAG: hypothetical protein OSA98_09210 [Rubripirellula sp.]|nr:hypothetical protein [Rubripirellula sp.]